MAADAPEVDREAVEVVQALVRNACVDDGHHPGAERPNAEVLAAVLDVDGIAVEQVDTVAGGRAVIARLGGRAGKAPALTLLGHLDVGPVVPERWSRDPFGGEVVDGLIWGRGTVYGLTYPATMAVALARLAREGFRPDGGVCVVALPDRFDRRGGGIRWAIDERLHDVGAEAVVCEVGGYPVPAPLGVLYPVAVASNGVARYRARVRGSATWSGLAEATPDAVGRAVEVVERLRAVRPAPFITALFEETLDRTGFGEVLAPLVDPARTDATLAALPPDVAPFLHAQTHPTVAVTGLFTERRPELLPDEVVIEVEVGLLPGQGRTTADAIVAEALDGVGPDVTVEPDEYVEPTDSPVDSPLWGPLAEATASIQKGAVLAPVVNFVPLSTTVALRRAGIAAFGAGAFSGTLPAPELGRLAGRDDERIDLESVGLLARFWGELARRIGA